MTPDADRVGGNMVEVVRNISQLTAADRMAIAAYIKSLPAVEGQTPSQKSRNDARALLPGNTSRHLRGLL